MSQVRNFKPRLTLRSNVLRRSLQSYIVTPIAKCYQVIAVRALWNSQKLDECTIWAKRREIEHILCECKNVVCFFSCITAMAKKCESKKRKYKDTESEEEEEDEKYENYPGMAFWVAYDWPEHALLTLENNLTKLLLSQGLDIEECKAIKGRGRGEESCVTAYSATLSQVLKDHNCEKAMALVIKSQKASVKKAAHDLGYQINNVSISTEGKDFSVKPVQVILTERLDENVRKQILSGLNNIKHTNLNYLLIDHGNDVGNPVQMKPDSNFCKAIDVINRAMDFGNYGICEGSIYRKIPESKFTSIFCCSIEKFLLTLLGNREIANVIGNHMAQLTNLLSKRECRLIKPLEIDYNLIEVQPYGYVFNVEEKRFVDMTQETIVKTPRAYIKYSYDENSVPYPEKFIEGIENSIPNEKRRHWFYQKYYQLLMHGKFPQKERKLVLVGPSDSGKSSWFCPFQGIIAIRNIASVVPDGRFSGSNIRPTTEIVFMDEWTSNSFSCGLITLPNKHKDVSTFVYNSGFFITTNVYPDFGAAEDVDAVKRRLAIFTTKTLRDKDLRMTRWLRQHCMEIFHFLANELKDTPIFEQGNLETQSLDEGAIYNDFDGGSTSLLLDVEQLNCFSLEDHDKTDCSQYEVVPQKAVDEAVLDADRTEGILYEHLTFESNLADYTNSATSAEYLEKVFKLVSSWSTISKILTQKTMEVFNMRVRTNWKGPDSIYDAWLLINNMRRDWFAYRKFKRMYPNWQLYCRETSSDDSDCNCNDCPDTQQLDQDEPQGVVTPQEITDSEEDIKPDIQLPPMTVEPFLVGDKYVQRIVLYSDSESEDEEYVKV